MFIGRTFNNYYLRVADDGRGYRDRCMRCRLASALLPRAPSAYWCARPVT